MINLIGRPRLLTVVTLAGLLVMMLPGSALAVDDFRLQVGLGIHGVNDTVGDDRRCQKLAIAGGSGANVRAPRAAWRSLAAAQHRWCGEVRHHCRRSAWQLNYPEDR